MTYVFEKRGFKGHLRQNATRSWFSKRIDNARYKTINGGIADIEKCADRYTVRVKDILRHPIHDRNVGAEVAASGATLATGILGFGFGIALAPVTGGASLLLGASGVAGTVGAGAIAVNIGRPGDVYFLITGDDSQWVAKNVDTHRMWELANNICKWSNKVYQEKFETYAYQEQSPKW